jgi:hypothetical protein
MMVSQAAETLVGSNGTAVMQVVIGMFTDDQQPDYREVMHHPTHIPRHTHMHVSTHTCAPAHAHADMRRRMHVHTHAHMHMHSLPGYQWNLCMCMWCAQTCMLFEV